MHDALTTDENNTLTTEEHIIHLQDKWWVHDALATSCDTGTITSSQSHTTDALLSLRRWVASSKTRNSLHLKQSSRSCAHQPDMRAGCIDCHLLSEHNRWLSIKNLMQFNARGDAFHQRASPDLAHCIGDDGLEFVLGQNMLWCCHQLGLGMSYSGANIKLSACGEHMQQMWIFTTLSLTLSLQWNFLFLQSCRTLNTAAIAIGGI